MAVLKWLQKVKSESEALAGSRRGD